MGAESTVDDRSLTDPRRKGFRLRATVEDVLATIDARINRLDVQKISLVDAAGRVLAHDVVAAAPVPPFDRTAMDGFALRGEETFGADPYAPGVFHVVGLCGPGRPMTGRVGFGEAAEIATGAPVPEGADAVASIESGTVQGDCVRVFKPFHPAGTSAAGVKILRLPCERSRVVGCCDRRTSASSAPWDGPLFL